MLVLAVLQRAKTPNGMPERVLHDLDLVQYLDSSEEWGLSAQESDLLPRKPGDTENRWRVSAHRRKEHSCT